MNGDKEIPEPQGQLEQSMLPFVMRELLALVMKKKHLPMEEALYYIYSSRLYKLLLRPQAKMWYSSTLSLYEDLEKEKSKLRHSQDNNPSFCSLRCSAWKLTGKRNNSQLKMLFYCFPVVMHGSSWKNTLRCCIHKVKNIS